MVLALVAEAHGVVADVIPAANPWLGPGALVCATPNLWGSTTAHHDAVVVVVEVVAPC